MSAIPVLSVGPENVRRCFGLDTTLPRTRTVRLLRAAAICSYGQPHKTHAMRALEARKATTKHALAGIVWQTRAQPSCSRPSRSALPPLTPRRQSLTGNICSSKAIAASLRHHCQRRTLYWHHLSFTPLAFYSRALVRTFGPSWHRAERLFASSRNTSAAV